MKTILIASLSLLLSQHGCNRMNLNRRVDPFQDGYFGYWKLESYRVGKRNIPINSIPEMYFIKVEMDIVQADSAHENTMYPKGSTYWKFTFFNESLEKKVVRPALRYDSDYTEKSKEDYQWFQINEISGFVVILDVVTNGFPNKMQLSNVIQGATRDWKLDSVRYVYRPTAKFD